MARQAKILFLCVRCRRPVSRLGKKVRSDHKICDKCKGRTKSPRSDKGKAKVRPASQSLTTGQHAKDFKAPQGTIPEQATQVHHVPVKKVHPAILAIREGLRECRRKKLI